VFAPPGLDWRPVSTRLRRLRRAVLATLLAVLVPLVALSLGLLVAAWAGVAGGAVLVLAGAWAWSLIGRNWRSWGYCERDEDLLITHGVLFRQLVVVPYGRMQFVDLTAGPLDRRVGIATIELHTATTATDATIPGLEADEAARLRDRLTALGEASAAGI
jgi:membrane protein YdbS with pleckstrin-like domain